jgi:hypothetical protein
VTKGSLAEHAARAINRQFDITGTCAHLATQPAAVVAPFGRLTDFGGRY